MRAKTARRLRKLAVRVVRTATKLQLKKLAAARPAELSPDPVRTVHRRLKKAERRKRHPAYVVGRAL